MAKRSLRRDNVNIHQSLAPCKPWSPRPANDEDGIPSESCLDDGMILTDSFQDDGMTLGGASASSDQKDGMIRFSSCSDPP